MESFRGKLDKITEVIGDCIFFICPEDIAFEAFRNTGYGYCAVIYKPTDSIQIPNRINEITNLILAPYYPYGKLLNAIISELKCIDKCEKIKIFKFIGNDSIVECSHNKDRINSEYIVDITDKVLSAVEHARKIKELLN